MKKSIAGKQKESLQNHTINFEQPRLETQTTVQTLQLPGPDNGLNDQNLLFALSRDIILFIRLRDGRILNANPAASQVYGYSQEELLTLSIYDLRAAENHLEVFSQMKVANQEGLLFETIHRRKDGSSLPVEVNSQSARLNHEEVLISIIRDISHRKQVEQEREKLLEEVKRQKEEAQQSAEQLKAVIDTLEDPVLVYNQEGVIVRANASAARTYTFDPSGQHRDFSNKRMSVRYRDGRTVSSSDLPSARALKGEHVIAEHLEATNQHGQKTILEISSIPLVISSTQVGAVSVWHDITKQQQTEQALRESEERLRVAILNIPAVFAQTDAELRYTWIYNSHPDFNDAEVIGKRDDELDDSEYTRRLIELKRQVLQTGNGYRGEISFNRSDGTNTYDLTIEPLRNIKGKIIGVSTSALDITGTKRIEEQLRQSLLVAEEGKRVLEAIMDHIPEGITIADAPDVVVRLVSRFGTELLGNSFEQQTAEEIVSQIQVFSDDGTTLLPVEELPLVRAIKRGEVVKNQDIVMVSPSKKQLHLSCNAGPIRDASGAITAGVLAWTEVSERKQAEFALRESETRFRELADSMPQLVWTAKPDGTVDYYNIRYQEFAGILPGEDENWHWSPVLHPDDIEPTVEAWQRSVETGQIYQIEHRTRMNDGSFRWHLSRGIPTRDATGQVTRWFGTATDIHDQKLAEEKLGHYTKKLENSNRALQDFAYVASHDLQEPLRKIESFGNLLLESTTGLDYRQKDFLERMQKAAGRMRGMVDGLLQLSRAATHGNPFVPVNLNQIAEEVLSDLEYQIQRSNARVELAKLPEIEADPIQVRQLFQNLISNALKYHFPGESPEVSIYAKERSSSVQIHVRDQGIGLEQAKAEQIFLPFKRLVGRSQYEGSGIGLAICNRIVERHNGKISVHSEPGKGATFIVTLPKKQAHEIEN